MTALVDANERIAARYLYDPFGNTLSATGPQAAFNRYRFSSKPIHETSGMYDYLYRWYTPELQQWVSRDALGELRFDGLSGVPEAVRIQIGLVERLGGTGDEDGEGLYTFLQNSPVNEIDAFGLVSLPPGWHGPGQPYDPSSNPFCKPVNPCDVLAALLPPLALAVAKVCPKVGPGHPACQALVGAYAGAAMGFVLCAFTGGMGPPAGAPPGGM